MCLSRNKNGLCCFPHFSIAAPPRYFHSHCCCRGNVAQTKVRGEERFWRTCRPVKFVLTVSFSRKKLARLENLLRVFPPPCLDYSSTLFVAQTFFLKENLFSRSLSLSYLPLTLLRTFCLQIRRSLTDVGEKNGRWCRLTLMSATRCLHGWNPTFPESHNSQFLLDCVLQFNP